MHSLSSLSIKIFVWIANTRLETDKTYSLTENHTLSGCFNNKVNLQVKETRYPIPENLSEDSKSYSKALSSKYEDKVLHESNFTTLGKISEQEKIEIIQTGFQLQAQNKISLKKYYESFTEPNSLFQLKGYSIKYESIRRTKIYQQLKL